MNKKVIQLELNKCADHFIYFLTKYISLRNAKTNVHEKFDPADFHLDILDHILEENKQLSLLYSTRQMGETTLIAAYCIWSAKFHDAKVVADFGLIRWAMDAFEPLINLLPFWMTSSIIITSGGVIFGEGKGIISFTRQPTPDIIFIDHPYHQVDAVLEYIEENKETSKLIVVTGKPLDKMKPLEELAVPYRTPYHVVEGRDDAWAAERIKTIGRYSFEVEYNMGPLTDAEFERIINTGK